MNYKDYRELAYNGSCYYDETAYKALKNLKEDTRMSEVYKGDIWTVQRQSGAVCEVLVLAKHERYVTCLTLSEREPMENPVKVKSKNIMYTDVGKVNYVFAENLLDYVKQLSNDEFQKIMKRVLAALDVTELLNATDAPHAATEPQAGISSPTPPETAHGAAETVKAADSEEVRELQMQLLIAQTERDVYKELFQKACPQMGGAAV